MADYQLTQTGAEVQDILDNAQSGKYFYNQSVASWSSDATYSDYPYKGTITINGVKGTDGVEVTFSNADATSGNYAPICNTVADGVEIWAKAQDNALTIPTIHITTGADVQLSGGDSYLPISGGNITGSLSVVSSPVLTQGSIKSYTLTGTTTGTGAIEVPVALRDKLMSIVPDVGEAVLVYRRDVGYFTIKYGTDLSAYANKAVTLYIYYIA